MKIYKTRRKGQNLSEILRESRFLLNRINY